MNRYKYDQTEIFTADIMGKSQLKAGITCKLALFLSQLILANW